MGKPRRALRRQMFQSIVRGVSKTHVAVKRETMEKLDRAIEAAREHIPHDVWSADPALAALDQEKTSELQVQDAA